MISFEQKGDFSKLTSFLNNLKGIFGRSDLDKYGQRGVDALLLLLRMILVIRQDRGITKLIETKVLFL